MHTLAEAERKVVAAATTALVGKTVVRVRYMTSDEAEELEFQHRPVVLEFNDGTIAYTASDEMPNDAGVLFVETKKRELCLGRLPV